MNVDPSSLPSAARELFALEPEGFIAARDALAKELKAGGDAEMAARVRSLRRPTVAAWAMDRAVRAEPDLVDALLAAGERLAGAQRQALSGKGGANALRGAGEERRDLIRQLTQASTAVLRETGRQSDGSRDEIAGTFEAATLDREVAARLRAGILERVIAPPPGLGGIEGFRVLEGGAGASGQAPARSDVTDRRDAKDAARAAERADAAAVEAEERARSARAAAGESARQAIELDATARAAERDARRLASEAKIARARADRAARRLGDPS